MLNMVNVFWEGSQEVLLWQSCWTCWLCWIFLCLRILPDVPHTKPNIQNYNCHKHFFQRLYAFLECIRKCAPKFTTLQHRTRNGACIVACIAVTFCSEKSQPKCTASQSYFLLCTLHCTNRLCWSHQKRSNHAIRIVGWQNTSHHRMASSALGGLSSLHESQLARNSGDSPSWVNKLARSF